MPKNQTVNLPEYLSGPAFLVEDEIVTQLNAGAEQRQIPLGVKIRELISVGSREYDSFRSGKLYLQLSVAGVQYNVCVSCYKKAHLFCILSDYASTELQVLSLTSTNLRSPLHSALDGIGELSKRLANSADPFIRKSFGQINRGLHQMLRSIGNMSDAALYSQHRLDHYSYLEAGAMLAEIAEKLQSTIPPEICNIRFTGLAKQVLTMADPLALERAIYNLVSNAVKFSSRDSVITLKASVKENRLYISLDNECTPEYNPAAQLFDNYLRDPSIEENRYGIGLGLQVVQNIAIAHYGTLLVTKKNKNTASFVLSLPIRDNTMHTLRAPLDITVDYSGGFDLALVELSEILPDKMYESI